MDIQLIQGNFSAKDALKIITQMVHIKIRYHESKISCNSNEEDIKYREKKIKKLQSDLSDIKKFIDENGEKINIQSSIYLSE